MKQLTALTCVLLALAITVPVFAEDVDTVLPTEKDKVAYIIGLNLGTNLMRDGLAESFEALKRGAQDAFSEAEPLIDETASRDIMMAFGKKRQEEMMKEREIAGEKARKEGEAFLEENATKEGVHVTDSGLQYMVLEEGDGPMPTANDQVKVNYKGMLLDGTEFDSSYKRGEPATFGLNQVIRGWSEGLQLMKVGSKYKFFIPSDLAYGPRGSRSIGPNETLIFEVELLEIMDAPPTPPMPTMPPTQGTAPAPKTVTLPKTPPAPTENK